MLYCGMLLHDSIYRREWIIEPCFFDKNAAFAVSWKGWVTFYTVRGNILVHHINKNGIFVKHVLSPCSFIFFIFAV